MPRKQKVTNDQIIADLDAGFTQKEIAAKHGITETAISQRITKMGLKKSNAAETDRLSDDDLIKLIETGQDLPEYITLAKRKELTQAFKTRCEAWLAQARANQINPPGISWEDFHDVLRYAMMQVQTRFGTDEEGMDKVRQLDRVMVDYLRLNYPIVADMNEHEADSK